MNAAPIANRMDLIRTFPRHGHVVEVGVFRGSFSGFIYNRSSPNHLWLVDTWDWPTREKGRDHATPGTPPGTGEDAYIEVMQRFWMEPRVSCLRLSSYRAAPLFQDGTLDWVYIDAMHYYESCLEDLRIWFPKIKFEGGIISGHDYQNHQVREAVETFASEHPDYRYSVTQEEVPSWWFEKITEEKT